MSLWMLAAFGCLSGMTTVLFGFGGGFVVVPLVYHLMIGNPVQGNAGHDATMQIAVATSTAVMLISASLASGKQYRAGRWVAGYFWPLAGYIALGAMLGALLAQAMSSEGIRIAFMVYLGLTIADCLLRKGFLQPAGQPRTTLRGSPLKGVAIGTVATLLGVGGSVMTVPLLRRAGLSMAQSSALANPLSLPVALIGSLMYALTGHLDSTGLSQGFLGFIYLPAFGLLTLGAWVGVRLALPLAGKISDTLHARVYIGLLMLVLLALATR
ncbi:sulfite exporter TauE/SafE family protein [Pseudomonas sp. dw_358]|uniref:sulfite exporter TauE/SafE family protein n=1 Tax=Pseudomonas sp. dw_358 TaxID=2720083 RepID=UPI001BD65A0B|nr:sulfite exporter TauE/SafE family protein [Pseudomonas sp. dw_358]